MSSVQRWNSILDRLAEQGALDVGEVAAELDVSPSTIRRDLRQLEEQGLLSRTHGGALPSSAFYELPLRYRGERHAAEKLRIAREAARRVADDLAVGLTGGTTTTQVAREIAEHQNITIVTNALNIATELAIRPNLRIVVTGGVARARSYELAGPLAERTLESINLDLVFAGVDGITARNGLTTHHETEARTNNALIGRARTTIVTADSSKLGRAAFSAICAIDAISELITDTGADPAEVAALRERGVAVTLV